ncbi:arrestin family protein [Luteolibacter flavescens]|uniref:Arrestin family protein n=1 Tax=Luteolibacter flavescens TaxID=1859460 RepID=A0ABT3FW85_9BACT|nr:arrestin family protein [Luteolibacter flavescens]MCW1887579.1 arrestin family protein [Luteolibacter flavescens]
MTGIRLFFALLFSSLCLATAHAQVEVRMTMGRNNFVAGESVPVSISVTNRSGQDIILQGNNRTGWLDLMVSSLSGKPLTPMGQPTFGAVKIGLGQTMSRTVDLAQIYPLQTVGNYSVYAVVRMPGQENGVMSNRLTFNSNSARTYWTQKIGLPGKPGQGREYKVLQFNSGSKTMLYAQVIDTRTGNSIKTHPLGEALVFRKPSVTLDNRQVMHVLYLISPDMWGHVRVDSAGKLLGRELHKRGAGSDPVLYTSRDGIVEVGNSIPYDPRAEAEARRKVRKASDRPTNLIN